MSSHALGGRRNGVLRTMFIAAAGLALSVAAALPAGADVEPATAIPIAGFTSFHPVDPDLGTRVGDNVDEGTRVGEELDEGTRVGDEVDRGTRVGDELDLGTRVGAETASRGTRVG